MPPARLYSADFSRPWCIIGSPMWFARSKVCYGLLWLEPIESGGEAQHAHEAGGRLLVAGCNGALLLEPSPEPFLGVSGRIVEPA
jgi:hypothetical protein